MARGSTDDGRTPSAARLLARPPRRGLPDDRRASGRPGRWLPLFARPLAADDHRAQFWARHLRLGVALSEVTCILGILYLAIADRPHHRLSISLGLGLMVLSPVLLLVPMRRWSRDLRGVVVFYAWSVVTVLAIAVICVLDGGATSPLSWMLVLSLTFAGLAYPPVGTLVMGGVAVVAQIGIAWTGTGRPAQSAVQVSVLMVLAVMISWASRNQWELVDEQHTLAQALAAQAETDSLTCCLNRRAFYARLAAAASRAEETAPLSLCMIDLDGFKSVNDNDGHVVGDELLVAIAEVLTGHARESDVVGRLGGDEFAVLLAATPAGVAVEIGERLRAAVAATGRRHGVTASLGIATTLTPTPSRTLLVQADRHMYAAKRAGGDRTWRPLAAG